MSWFDSSGFAGFAKTALTNAQKKIDKVLDIEEIESAESASDPSSTSSSSASSSQRSGRVPSSVGGGAFAAYGAYVPPAAPKTPSSIHRDAESTDEGVTDEAGQEGNSDWGNQSSLWSSWFDFSGNDQGGGVDVNDSEEAGGASGGGNDVRDFDSGGAVNEKLKPIVAAQPPRAVECKNEDREASDASFEAPSAAESAESSKSRDNELKRSGSVRGRKSRDSTEAKRAKPAAPKKLGQRVGEMKIADASRNPVDSEEAAGRDGSEVVSSRNADDSGDISKLDNSVADGNDEAVKEDVNDVVDPSSLPLTDVSSLGSDFRATSPSRDVEELSPDSNSKPGDVSPMILSTHLNRVTPLTSSTSLEGGATSLSASALWEVKEGDAEVEAILRKHETEMEIDSAVSRDRDSVQKLASESSFRVISSESLSLPEQGQEVVSPESSTEASLSKSSSREVLTSQPAFAPLPDVFASLPDHNDAVDQQTQRRRSNDAGLNTSMSVEKCSTGSFNLPSSTSSTSVSSSSASATDQTVHPSSESTDLTSSFTLSQPSPSATKLTDSSTTDGTLEPEEEEERAAEVAVESRDIDVAIPAETGTTVADPTMSTSVSSIASSVVKDLLGDAMSESLTLPTTPPRKPEESPKSIVDDEGKKKEPSTLAGTADDDSYDDDEGEAGGSISDCGKGYNSSDEIQTACTTSDEREETATSSDIEIISNPSIMDGDVNDRRFEVTSPVRSFGPLPISELSQDVIFHHQSLQHGHSFHQRTPSQSSSCSSSANPAKKKNFSNWNELKVDTREGAACESDSPFESPNFGDSENEEKEKEKENEKEKESTLMRKPKLESAADVKEREKSAASVRQRLLEETGGGFDGSEDSVGGHGGGRRTPKLSRSRKSSERHLSTATLTASSEDKRDNDNDNDVEEDGDAAAANDDVTKELLKKMKDMSEVIQAREANAFDLSKMNAELTETVTLLRQQVANAIAARDNTSQEMEEMKGEFGRRLAESENKLRSTAQDRDAVKRELNQALKDVQSKAALEAIVKEKEDLVQELMEEGRKLSLQLGNANTALRKLRTKEKEGEGVSQRRKEKAEAAEKRVEELEVELEEALKRDKTKSSRLQQIEEKVSILESIKFEAESQMEDDRAKMDSLKVSLEAANQEISALKGRVIEADSLVAEAEGKAERNAAKAMEREFELAQETLIAEREALAAALEDLRVHVSRQERDVNRREDVLKQELSALQLRLQEADERNEQLVESMGGATLPLLRQIENLKLTMSTQAASWEAVEANLNDRLMESQEHLIASEEKERVVSEELFELRGRLTAETSKASSLSTEKTLLKTELETLKMKLNAAEEAKSAQALQTSSVKTALYQEINELKIVKLDLESQVEFLGSKVVELERRHRSVSPPPPLSPHRSSTPRPFSPPPALMTQSSMTSVGVISGGAPAGAVHPQPAPSLYSVVRDSGASLQTEEMQSQLKQKDGEICQLQTDIMNLELTRESMASELVELANKNTTMEENIKHYPILKKQYADMEVQYNALLQMFGEKAEEYDELRMDLEHVKSMYKQQIEELIQKDSFRR